MLLNDIKTLIINSVKYSRTSGIYAVLKSPSVILWEDSDGSNNGGGEMASNYGTTRFELFCTKYATGYAAGEASHANNNVKYYPIKVNYSDNGRKMYKVLWAAEHDIANFDVIGG